MADVDELVESLIRRAGEIYQQKLEVPHPVEKPPLRMTWQVVFLALIALGIVVCEYVFTHQSAVMGIAISLVLVLAINISLVVLPFIKMVSRSAESLTLIPLYILFTSSLPWFFVQQQYLIPAVYSCILALCFWHIYRSDLSIKSFFGFNPRSDVKWIALAVLVALPLGSLEYYILKPAATTPSFQLPYFFMNVVYMLFFVGLGEELLFRGFIQKDLTEAFGWKWGLFATSALFAVMHMTWRSIPELFFVFAAALLMGGLYIKTKSLLAPIALHAVNNVVLVAVMPFLWHLS